MDQKLCAREYLLLNAKLKFKYKIIFEFLVEKHLFFNLALLLVVFGPLSRSWQKNIMPVKF